MSAWTIATWAAIVTLALGALAVFAWFLVDAVKLLKSRRRTNADADT
jgi:hypothetical protein